MPSTLRAKVALVGLFSVLLIPLYTSSLRGLTHVLTCAETTDADFTLQVGPDGVPSILSSVTLERGSADRTLCDGLVVDVRIGAFEPGRAEIVVAITNRSEFDWEGSVRLQIGDTGVPVGVGGIEAGSTATESVDVRLDEGRDYQIGGRLLVGP